MIGTQLLILGAMLVALAGLLGYGAARLDSTPCAVAGLIGMSGGLVLMVFSAFATVPGA